MGFLINLGGNMAVKFSDDFLSFDDPFGERNVVSVAPLRLSDVISGAVNTTIEADVIIVDKPIEASGFSLKLRCRILQFLDNSSIASNGSSGLPSYSPNIKPLGPQDPGSIGADGLSGGDGKAGGSIEICCDYFTGHAILTSIGGNGGRGQDGGDGLRGMKGPLGQKIIIMKNDSHPHISAYSGGSGTPGGAVGLPGTNGLGGPKGSIIFKCLRKPKSNFDAKIGSGSTGENANSGSLGIGGDGGDPGSLHQIYYEAAIPVFDINSLDKEDNLSAQLLIQAWSGADSTNIFSLKFRDPPPQKVVEKIGDGNSGEKGLDGSLRAQEVAARQIFTTSVIEEIDLEITSAIEIGPLFSESFLEMQISSLEDEFRLSGLEVSEVYWERLNFYLSLTEKSSNSIVSSFFSRLCSMARKIQLGLDFFGYSKEYVPLLAMATYKDLLDNIIIDQVRFIEQQHNYFIDKLESKEDQLIILKRVVDSTRGQLITYTSLKSPLESDIIKLLASITGMNASVNDAYQQLLVGKSQLDDAFKRKTSNGCDFVQTLAISAVLVAGVVATGGSALAIAGGTSKFVEIWNKNNASASTLWDSKMLLQESLKSISADINGFADGIKAVQGAYESLTSSQKTQNLPALTIERDKFDKIAKDFADLPEAAEYKKLGYAYLDRVESRNKAVLDYNAQLVRLIELIHLIDATKAMEKVAESTIMGSTDISAPIVFTRLKRIRRASLDLAAQLIHAQEKAMAYLFCTHATPKVSARNALEIEAAHAAVTSSWIRAKESYKPIKTLKPGAFRIQLKRFAADQDWKRFTSLKSGNRPLQLSINVRDIETNSPLLNLPGLRITGARLIFDGIQLQVDDVINWVMYQDGRETLITPDGETIRYAKLPARLQGFISESDVVDSDNSENGIYSGLSIFSTWRLVISESTRKIDYNSLKDLVLAIDGYYMA